MHSVHVISSGFVVWIVYSKTVQMYIENPFDRYL